MLERKKKLKLVLDIILITLFVVLIIYATVRLGPTITMLAGEPDQLRDILFSYGWKGTLLFMLLQALQVVIAAIPGEVVQIAGGFVYGTLAGTLYSLIGIVTGSVIVFYISRLLGYSIVRMFVSPKNLKKFEFMINDNKSEIAMFILFLLPGLPKDILTYIAGLTPVKPARFFITIMVARLPALLVSSYIGANLQNRNYTIVIILSAAAVVLFITGILLKDKIIHKISNL